MEIARALPSQPPSHQKSQTKQRSAVEASVSPSSKPPVRDPQRYSIFCMGDSEKNPHPCTRVCLEEWCIASAFFCSNSKCQKEHKGHTFNTVDELANRVATEPQISSSPALWSWSTMSRILENASKVFDQFDAQLTGEGLLELAKSIPESEEVDTNRYLLRGEKE